MKVVHHPDFHLQTQGPGHPERPERLTRILEYLDAAGVHPDIIHPEPAPFDTVAEMHSPEYLELLRDFGTGRLDMDTAMFPHTYNMAMLAAGGGIAAVRDMLSTGQPVAALLRPPGHHATRDMGMGFCYINNIAVAASWLRKNGLDRVAIVDIDVHHGNGTNDMFLDRPDVLYISTHQWGIYPGTGPAEQVGTGKGEGYTVNIPLPSGSGDATFREAWERIMLPVLGQYRPGALLVSLGADAHYRDPLATLTLSSAGYLELMGEIASLAGRICGGRWALFLEGGYDLDALAEVVGGIIVRESGAAPVLRHADVRDSDCVGRDAVAGAADMLGQYWDL